MQPEEQLSGRARRRRVKREKNQARRDARTAAYVALRMNYGQVPERLKGLPTHMLTRYLETGVLYPDKYELA